uniref:hypothetical protein n=1 Tax=Treponema sp. TaxID=166 RepID=UPI00298E8D53
MKKLISILPLILFCSLFVNCKSVPTAPPVDKHKESEILKTENIEFDGDEWFLCKFDSYFKNHTFVFSFTKQDGTTAKIWSRVNDDCEIFILNFPKPKGKIQINIDDICKKFNDELYEKQKLENERLKRLVIESWKHGKKIAQYPCCWTFTDTKKKSKVTIYFGFPDKDEAEIRLDGKKDFCVWRGKYALTEDAFLLYVTQFSESVDGGISHGGGVMGYNDLDDFISLSYSLSDDTLTINGSLNDVLPFDAIEKYKFPVPLVLQKEE